MMRAKQKIRLCVDFVMVILMPCLMAYAFMEGKLHEWLGLAMFLLFFLHHLLNAGWHRALGKGAYTANRILGTVTNLLLLLAMVFLAVSSVILSGYAPWNIKGSMAAARLMHLALSYWVFVLASFHLGIYWNRIPAARKVMADKKYRLCCGLLSCFMQLMGYMCLSKGSLPFICSCRFSLHFLIMESRWYGSLWNTLQ